MSDESAAITASPTVSTSPAWVGRVLRIEWLGQTTASLCWIVSVFVYGISSAGDVLQLCAASAWLLANIAAVATARDG
ncbi:MAG: hypothetical protein AAGD32_08140 [Planctomycetota bacterium]